MAEAIAQQEEKQIEVKRSKRNILETEEFLNATGEIVVPIGKDAQGKIIVEDLHEIPHMLVCGYTGSGKSSFVETILSTISTRYSSNRINFIIYDSKVLEYSAFNNVPHLNRPIVTDRIAAIDLIKAVSDESKKRLQQFAAVGKRELYAYNAYCESVGKEGYPELFFVLDDFSTINVGKETLMSLLEILRDGRIVGVHLVIVSSVASAKILQKDLLSNIPCKVAFCVSTKAESKVVLEDNGAENLFVPGEMIYKVRNNRIKCQCVHAEDDNIRRVLANVVARDGSNLKSLGGMAATIFGTNVKPRQITKAVPNVNVEPEYSYDMLISEAAEAVLRNNTLSIAQLQRMFKIGFNRAARIADQLEELGLVGEEKGYSPRKVLLTVDEWNKICKEKGLKGVTSKTLRPGWGSEDKDEGPEIKLRDYPKIQIGETTISVSDSHIKYSIQVMTPMGSGTMTPSFSGDIVTGIIYKKPRFFSKGYLMFKYKSDVNIVNSTPHLVNANKQNLSDITKIEFGQDEANTVWLFAKQISEDTHIAITVI